MPKSGGQPGNDNAHRGAEWKRAIKRSLSRKSGKTYREGLDLVADQFIEAASQGDAWALKEMGDRIDGKPAQAIDLQGDLKVKASGTVSFKGMNADPTD